MVDDFVRESKLYQRSWMKKANENQGRLYRKS